MNVNLLAVLAAAVASMVIGSIWYGPLFGKTFIAATGMDKWTPEKQAEMKKAMTLTYLWQFVASIVMFYVFAKFMVGLNEMSVMGGLVTALWVWIGFIVPIKLADSLWGGKMITFWLGAGNTLLTMLAAGLIIGAWR
jgi:hypothetical protein